MRAVTSASCEYELSVVLGRARAPIVSTRHAMPERLQTTGEPVAGACRGLEWNFVGVSRSEPNDTELASSVDEWEGAERVFHIVKAAQKVARNEEYQCTSSCTASGAVAAQVLIRARETAEFEIFKIVYRNPQDFAGVAARSWADRSDQTLWRKQRSTPR